MALESALRVATATLAAAVRTTACVVVAVVLGGGCSLTIPEVVKPASEPGRDYYEGYMAGASFATDAWNHAGDAAVWLDAYSLTATDVAIQKALMNLPPRIVENHSSVWVEAFRSGASTRFDQYRQAVRHRNDMTALAVVAGLAAANVVLWTMVLIQRAQENR